MANYAKSLMQVLRENILNTAKWVIGFLYLILGAPGYKSRIIAFVFHEVGDSPRGHARLTNTYSTNKNFLKQISLLSTNFEFINPERDSQWVNKTGCLITFDDGYKGALEAAKTLEAQGIASIHFVNLQTIYGQVNSSALLHFISIISKKETVWSDSKPTVMEKAKSRLSRTELKNLVQFSGPYMNQIELQELNSLDLSVMGDHFLNHWYTDSLTNNEIIENLSRNVQNFNEKLAMKPYFAAPHGQISIEKMELIAKQGYDVIFSGLSWMKIGNTTIIPRIDMNNSISSKTRLFGAIAILIIRSKLKPKN